MAKRPTKAAKATAVPSPSIGLRSTADGMQNLVSGMGTEKDKAFSTFFGFSIMDRAQLDAAYRGDWISRKGVNIPAEDSTREWREWQADPKDVTAIETVEKDLGIQEKVKRAMIRGRLYGGGALVLGVNQGKPEEPIILDTLDTDCLQFVHVVSRFEISNGPIEWDITSPYYGQPKYYQQSSSAESASMRLHPSRVVRFIGNEIPDLNVANGWGDSVLQSVSDAAIGSGIVTSSIAQLVAEAKIDVIKIPGLSENIQNSEYEARLKKRFGFANTVKSVFSMLLLDKEEEWERINSQFAGLPDILKVYLLIASGALDIPATRFLGQSPVGLSATGESDTQNYYDRISADQKTTLQPAICNLDEILIRSALGRMPDSGEGDNADITYSWRPLWQMTETEKADVAVKKATVAKTDHDMGLINSVVLKKAREAQLAADGFYPGFEQILEKWDDDPDMVEANAEPDPLMVAPPPITDPSDPNYDPTLDPNSPQFKQVPSGQPKQLAPPTKQAKKGAQTQENQAIDGMARRLKDATTPRTLYVRRDLLNQKDLKAWAKKQGFKTSLTDMHVTIAYSKEPVDWITMGSDWGSPSDSDGKVTVSAGGPRVMEKFGKAVVLAFACTDFSYRNRSMLNRGATWDHEDYTPHITITYDGGDLDIMHMKAYDGPLEFGPEIFEEIKTGFNNEVDTVEDGLKEPSIATQIADAIRAQPAPQVTVHVPVPPSGSKRTKETVRVTKHDAVGRIQEFEKITAEED
jgi:phage-related protein (TIGR01555 family)